MFFKKPKSNIDVKLNPSFNNYKIILPSMCKNFEIHSGFYSAIVSLSMVSPKYNTSIGIGLPVWAHC